nr:ribonuclease H-like domain-containing protein [Tanacetum cinerariifolium]
MFWTKAVSTACYVLNRVSITNPHNKTPYELLFGKVPNIRHLKPFGCQVTILNTSDHLGKFERKANDGFLVGYVAHSKAYRVYNLSSKIVEEMLNLRYLEDKPNDVSAPIENNLDYVEELARLQRKEYEAYSASAKHDKNFCRNLVPAAGDPAGAIVPTGGVPAGSDPASGIVLTSKALADSSIPASVVPAGSIPASSVLTDEVLAGSLVFTDSAASSVPAASVFVPAVVPTDYAANSPLPPGHSLGSCVHTTRFPSPSDLENHHHSAGIFSSSSYDDEFCADVTNLDLNVAVDPVATRRIHYIHPQFQILGDLQSPVQIRSTMQKSKFGEKPSSVANALADPDWVAAMQEEMQQFYHQQKDVRSAFLYGEIKEEVYVTQPKRFEDPYNPKHVYRVVKALYGLHQVPRACQDKYIKDMIKKFDMESVRTATTPYEVLKHKSKDEPDDAINVYLFRSMIDSLMYLIASWPDIIFAVSACSRHQLEAYSDSDYAGSHGDRKSTTGGCQFLGRRLILWQCKKQTVIATSSTKAKYVVVASCCGQLLIPAFGRVPTGSGPFFYWQFLVHARELVSAGGCTLPAGSNSFLLWDTFLLSDSFLLVRVDDLVSAGGCTLPAVSACSRHQVSPLTSHLNAVKKIFKYLKGQPNLGLWYPRYSPFQLEAYSDSDYAGSHGDRKSTTGGCSLDSKPNVRLWVQLHDAYEKKLIQVVKIHTDENVADLLTKAFDGPRFHYLI